MSKFHDEFDAMIATAQVTTDGLLGLNREGLEEYVLGLETRIVQLKECDLETYKRGWRDALGDVAITLGMGDIESHHQGELWVEKYKQKLEEDRQKVGARVAKGIADEFDRICSQHGEVPCVTVTMTLPGKPPADEHTTVSNWLHAIAEAMEGGKW